MGLPPVQAAAAACHWGNAMRRAICEIYLQDENALEDPPRGKIKSKSNQINRRRFNEMQTAGLFMQHVRAPPPQNVAHVALTQPAP